MEVDVSRKLVRFACSLVRQRSPRRRHFNIKHPPSVMPLLRVRARAPARLSGGIHTASRSVVSIYGDAQT